MALVRLGRIGRQLSLDDVLHHRLRLDVRVFPQDVARRLCKEFCRPGLRPIRRYVGFSVGDGGLYGAGDGAGFCRLLPWPQEGRGEDQQGDDVSTTGHYLSAGGAYRHPARCRRGLALLLGARFWQDGGAGRGRGAVLCYGAGILHPVHRYGLYGHLWQLHRSGSPSVW